MLQGRRDDDDDDDDDKPLWRGHFLLIYTSSDASDMCEVMCDVIFDNDSRERS